MARLVEGFAARLVVPDGERDIQIFDEALPGFGLRKFASGRASYFVKYSVGGQQRRLTLGGVVPGNLGAMRKEASAVLAKARLGQDVVADKIAAASKRSGPLSEVVGTYLDDRQPKLRPRYFAEIKRQLERDWKPLHSRSVDAIARADVVDLIDTIAAGQGAVAADRARVALSTLYAWAIERGYAENNPTSNISPRAAGATRTRVLTEDELSEIWAACGNDDYGRIVRLLLLTGQRRTELGDLAWPELHMDKRQIELPPERTKNGKPNIVPLSDLALTLLPERRDKRDLVFGRGDGGFSGWSRAKADLDARIAATRANAGIKTPLPVWVLHDLRRSFVTHVNERKFAPPHVVEAIVNHASGHLAGVAGTYNKALYLDERRGALQLWSDYISTLVQERKIKK